MIITYRAAVCAVLKRPTWGQPSIIQYLSVYERTVGCSYVGHAALPLASGFSMPSDTQFILAASIDLLLPPENEVLSRDEWSAFIKACSRQQHPKLLSFTKWHTSPLKGEALRSSIADISGQWLCCAEAIKWKKTNFSGFESERLHSVCVLLWAAPHGINYNEQLGLYNLHVLVLTTATYRWWLAVLGSVLKRPSQVNLHVLKKLNKQANSTYICM